MWSGGGAALATDHHPGLFLLRGLGPPVGHPLVTLEACRLELWGRSLGRRCLGGGEGEGCGVEEVLK